jgi:hypothetical protein
MQYKGINVLNFNCIFSYSRPHLFRILGRTKMTAIFAHTPKLDCPCGENENDPTKGCVQCYLCKDWDHIECVWR